MLPPSGNLSRNLELELSKVAYDFYCQFQLFRCIIDLNPWLKGPFLGSKMSKVQAQGATLGRLAHHFGVLKERRIFLDYEHLAERHLFGVPS